MNVLRVKVIIFAITVLSVKYSNTTAVEDKDAYQRNISSDVTRTALGGQDTIREDQLDKETAEGKIFVQQNLDTKEKTNLNANRRNGRIFFSRKQNNRIDQLDRYGSLDLLSAIKERLDKGQPLKKWKPIKPGIPRYEYSLPLAPNERLKSRFLRPDRFSFRPAPYLPTPRPSLILYDNMELLSAIKERLSKRQPLMGQRWYRNPNKGRPPIAWPYDRKPKPSVDDYEY